MRLALRRSVTPLLVVLGLVLAACGGDDAAPENAAGTPTADVGYVLTLSGFAALFGELQANGIQLAIKDLESRGIAELNLVAQEDSGESNTTALNGLRRALSEEPHVLLGPIIGTQVLALRPEVERAEIPMITGAATRSITQEGNKWLFQLNPHDGIFKSALVRFALDELGVQEPGIIHDATEYGVVGSDILVDLLSEEGVEPAQIESFNPEERQLAGQVKNIADADVDAVFIQALTGSPAAAALKAVRQQGIDVPILMSAGITSPSTTDLLSAEELEGVYAENPGLLDESDSEIRAFLDAYEVEYNSKPDIQAALMYDAVQMIGQVVADGASTPEEIWEGLSIIEYDGVVTTFRSDAEGALHHNPVILQFKQGKELEQVGAFEIEFEPRDA
jgi:branched-chain amino acid transport system substrate-binding protein